MQADLSSNEDLKEFYLGLGSALRPVAIGAVAWTTRGRPATKRSETDLERWRKHDHFLSPASFDARGSE